MRSVSHDQKKSNLAADHEELYDKKEKVDCCHSEKDLKEMIEEKMSM